MRRSPLIIKGHRSGFQNHAARQSKGTNGYYLSYTTVRAEEWGTFFIPHSITENRVN